MQSWLGTSPIRSYVIFTSFDFLGPLDFFGPHARLQKLADLLAANDLEILDSF
jgi:hypothetical protein